MFGCAQNEIEFDNMDLNFFVWGTKIQLSGQMGIFNDQIQKQDHKERDDENVIGDVWTEGGVKRHGRKS